MRFFLTVIGILGLLSPVFAEVPGVDGPGSALPSFFPAFQLGDWLGGGSGDEGGYEGDYGGGGFGDAEKRLSIAGFFALIFPKSEQAFDIKKSGARPPDWPYYYNNGMGFAAKLDYLLMPTVRIGGRLGYEFFQAKEREYKYTVLGTDYTDTYSLGSMNLLVGGVQVDFMIPVGMPSESWFSTKKGFVEGVVPYIGWEGSVTYRLRVRDEYYDDFIDETYDDEVMRPYCTFVNGLHGGVEIRLQSFGFFVEVAYLWYSPPKKGKDLSYWWRWDWMVAAPIRGGVVAYF